MVPLGNFLFHHRNKLFPAFYLVLFLPSPPVSSRVWLMMGIGVGVALVGQLVRIGTIGLRYIIRGGRGRRVYAEDLVTEGVFGHCRNPLYVGNVLVILGLGVMSNSLLFNLVVSPLFLVMYQAIVLAEEDFLGRKFGEAYERYRTDVNRWIPKLAGLRETFASMEFSWRRVLIREYTSTYIWLTAAVLIAMKHLATAADNRFYRDNWQWGAATLAVLLAVYLTIRTLKLNKVITAT